MDLIDKIVKQEAGKIRALTHSENTSGGKALIPTRETFSETKFNRGLEILTAAFPLAIQNPDRIKLMRSLLADLTEEEFVRGVKTLVLTHKEIYPNTNLIAVIRDYALHDPSELSPEEA